MTEDNITNENTEPVEKPINEEIISENISEKDNSENSKSTEDQEDRKKKHKKDKKDIQIEELGLKLVELSDKHLRLQAEFDNYRKRTMKEKAELIKSGGESVLLNIFPVVDDFERALATIKDVSDEDMVKKGILLIYNKFRDFLKQNNIKEIDALNQTFDVDVHEALTKIPVNDDSQKGKVVDVIQKGYLLNEKVVRFAKVVIGE
jgi:molecular chaperone GrpE